MPAVACTPPALVTWPYVALAALAVVQTIATAWLARRNSREHLSVKDEVLAAVDGAPAGKLTRPGPPTD